MLILKIKEKIIYIYIYIKILLEINKITSQYLRVKMAETHNSHV
jgi:hypothetical protein